MKPYRKNYFNMVEVTLALGVAVIGVVCIMALIPVGLNASRDATADNYLPDVAQELLTMIKLNCQAENGWAELNTSFPNTKPAAQDDWDPDDIQGSAYDVYLGDKKRAGGIVVYKKDVKEAKGIFLIAQRTKVSGTNDFVVDFSATARVWQQDMNDFYFFKNKIDSGMSEIAKAVFVEVSWPANIPHKRREELGNVRTYRMDLFNPEVKL